MLRAVLTAACLSLAGCVASPGGSRADAGASSGETVLSGETMGSAWTVKIAGALPAARGALRAGVQAEFDAVNAALSTYLPDSDLSRFNADDSGAWQAVSAALVQVLDYALSLAGPSGGAYDVTVAPLVDLWGFGPDPATHRVPDATAIAAARERVGWRKVEVDAARQRARKRPGVRVDLSSLGKGFGVDRVARFLDAHGASNYLIDLSGKLRARGTNGRRQPWRIAVEKPAADDPGGRPGITRAVLTLRDESVATAGDYRRYFEAGGRHYSHIIDPRTGAPVAHASVSATVVAADCMTADALATVLMVMPQPAALELADQRDITALIITREGETFRLAPSAAWTARELSAGG